MLLYPVINLDQFPWDCPSEVSLLTQTPFNAIQHRKRLYAAGVRTLHATGCLPLCVHWTFPDLLNYFPNVQMIPFRSTEVVWGRMVNPHRNFAVTVKPKIQDGAVVPRYAFYHVPDFDYEVLNRFVPSSLPSRVRPFTRKARGEVQLPEIFLLPFDQLDVEGVYPKKSDWYTILEQRKRLNIPSQTIIWPVQEGEDLSKFTSVAGPHVTDLYLNLDPKRDNISTALNSAMSGIRDYWLPGLERLIVYVAVDRLVSPEVAEYGETSTPDWVSNEMPEGLGYMSLVLAVDMTHPVYNEDTDYSEDMTWSMQEAVRKALPRTWIRNARIKLGDHFDLRVDVMRNLGWGLEDWVEPFEDELLYALHGPLTIDRSTQTVGQCTWDRSG